MVWLETDNLHSHPIKFYIAYNIERYWVQTSEIQFPLHSICVSKWNENKTS